MTAVLSANTDQVQFWNEVQGPKWVRLQERIDATLDPIGDAALAKLAVQRGERVLDVGSGCGTNTLTLVEQAGPEGHVTGVDISKPMIAHARERAAKVETVEFVYRLEDRRVVIAAVPLRGPRPSRRDE